LIELRLGLPDDMWAEAWKLPVMDTVSDCKRPQFPWHRTGLAGPRAWRRNVIR
jgi:hypothetical protein